MSNKPPSIEYLKQHPEEFRFEDYNGYKELIAALVHIFPEKTDRSYVEMVLKNQTKYDQMVLIPSNVVEKNSEQHNQFLYEFKKIYFLDRCLLSASAAGDRFVFKFNKNDELTGFDFRNGCGVYK